MSNNNNDNDQDQPFWRKDLVYTVFLFAAALVATFYAVRDAGVLAGQYDWQMAAFFVAFGLFTIATGFPHPRFGHVSFDRVAQVSSILVLGPVDAAWINGIASFLYPWHRLANGIPFRTVLIAALNNAGLMMLVVLLCGLLYQQLGGPVPLRFLDFKSGGLLLLLMLSMQFVNDLGMMAILYLRGMDPRTLFNSFTTAIESFSVLIAIVVAVAITTAPTIYVVLLLVVLSVGMLVIKQYALMRQQLERLVDDRTEELRVQAIEFERQATHDKLTGLPNRRYADDYLERALELAMRSGEKMTVALGDIDHFKQINDGYSHAVGDDVLRRVAHLLSDRCRKTDIVARYGGEEFLLCFPDTDSAFAEQVCNQIRLAVQNTDWQRTSQETGESLAVTISFGIAESHEDTRITTLLRDADARLYEAKKSGRNRVIA
ncbi:MAG: GGDEF domain-containing protein [Pseudomonadota bacterium]